MCIGFEALPVVVLLIKLQVTEAVILFMSVLAEDQDRPELCITWQQTDVTRPSPLLTKCTIKGNKYQF